MQSTASPWRGVFLDGRRPYAWLAALVLIIYVRCLTYGVILLDDNIYLRELFPMMGDWSSLPAVFRNEAFKGAGWSGFYYRPLMVVSFMVDAHLGGPNPDVFHMSNIAFHLMCVALVFRVLRLIVGGDKALLLSAVFAAHPALAGAVAWICGRTDTFVAMFVLASFHAYQLWLRDGRRSWLAAHLSLWAAALFCKELAVVLPAVCVAYGLLHSKRPPRLLAAGWAAGLAAWFAARRAFVAPPPGHSYSLLGMLASAAANLPAALMYWGKVFIPIGLSPYPILADAVLGVGGLAALLAAAALWRPAGADLRRAALGLIWFAVFLLPSFVYPSDSITPVFYEYRLYLPLVGALVLLSEAWPLRVFDLDDARHALAAAACILLLSWGAADASEYYRDDLSAWTRAVRVSPHSSFAHKQLGAVRYFRKDYSDAAAEEQEALRLNPREPLAHRNLGVIALEVGRIDDAEKQFETELEIDPQDESARRSLEQIRARRAAAP